MHIWHEALHQAGASVEVDLYACGAVVVLAQRGDCRTFQDLVTRFQAPDDDLVNVLIWLCWAGEILLRPQVLLGASCALRLGHSSLRLSCSDAAPCRSSNSAYSDGERLADGLTPFLDGSPMNIQNLYKRPVRDVALVLSWLHSAVSGSPP